MVDLAAQRDAGGEHRDRGRSQWRPPRWCTTASAAAGSGAGAEAQQLLAGYFAAGDPGRLAEDLHEAGLSVRTWDTWIGATTLDSIDSFLDVELLPIADRVDRDVRDRIVADSRIALAPFLDVAGAIAAPIEAHVVTASVDR